MEWSFGTLTMSDGQFIDIRVPRFAVLAIWPERREAVPDHGVSQLLSRSAGPGHRRVAHNGGEPAQEGAAGRLVSGADNRGGADLGKPGQRHGDASSAAGIATRRRPASWWLVSQTRPAARTEAGTKPTTSARAKRIAQPIASRVQPLKGSVVPLG